MMDVFELPPDDRSALEFAYAVLEQSVNPLHEGGAVPVEFAAPGQLSEPDEPDRGAQRAAGAAELHTTMPPA